MWHRCPRTPVRGAREARSEPQSRARADRCADAAPAPPARRSASARPRRQTPRCFRPVPRGRPGQGGRCGRGTQSAERQDRGAAGNHFPRPKGKRKDCPEGEVRARFELHARGQGRASAGCPCDGLTRSGPRAAPTPARLRPFPGAVLAPPTSLAGPAQGSWLRAAGGRLGLAHLRPAGGSTWPGLPPAPRNSRSLESDTAEAGRQWKYVFGKKTAGQSLSIKLGDTKVPPKTRLADKGTDDPISPVAGRD